MTETVKLQTDTAPGVATILLDRPKVNALNGEMIGGIRAACVELEGRDDIRAVVVWGGPRVFAAGADITEFVGLDFDATLELSHGINEAFLALEQLPQITIAAVNGYALGGGCELAISTDFRLAADTAVFGQPEILLGIIPGGGGTQRLARLIGVTRAKELIYTGRNVSAEEALAIGLVSAIHPAASLYDEAVALASQYAIGPAALQLAKQAIMDGLHLPLADGVMVEAELFAHSMVTEDGVTGVQSFIENGPGKATFQGK